jgi:hypothetical protein
VGLREQATNLAQTTGAERLGTVNMMYGKTGRQRESTILRKQKMNEGKRETMEYGKRKKCK